MAKSQHTLKRHLAGAIAQLKAAAKAKNTERTKKLKEEITWIKAQQIINRNKIGGWGARHYLFIKRPWWGKGSNHFVV